jgi:hypothetical protein
VLAVRQSAKKKKKKKQRSKHRNAEVRAALDGQAQEIYAITAKLDELQPPTLAEETDVQSLATSMRNLIP